MQELARDPELARWRLVIAGEGHAAYVTRLRLLAGAGEGRSRIEFAGWIDGARKAALLAEASLFVLPSHQENFGLSIVEALAAGVPAIVTPGVNLAGDIAAASAGWVVDRNVAALTETMRVAMKDDSDRARRGRAGRSFADRYRWAVIGRQLSRCYEDTVARAGLGHRTITPPAGPALAARGGYRRSHS
jgi:glycosyltransferase involved in cell wall biosynthesis